MFVLDLGSTQLRVAYDSKSTTLPVNGAITHGVIADEEALVKTLSKLRQTMEPSPKALLLRPPAKGLIHAMYRPIYQDALVHTLKRAGFGSITLVHEAVGVDRIVRQQRRDEPCGYLDIGEGKLDACIVANGVVIQESGRAFGVDRLLQRLRSCVETTLQIAISDQELISLLLQLSVEGQRSKHHHDIRGKDLRDYSLVSLRLRSEQVLPVIELWLQEVALLIEQLLEQLPSELHTQLLSTGIELYGGGSLLDGIDQWLATRLELPVACIPQPMKVALRGALL